MFKIICYIFFAILFIIIGIDLIDDLFNIEFTYYLWSMFVLGLGVVLYPFNFKFKFKTDYIFLFVFAFVFVNLINMFFFYDFSFTMYWVNVCIGVFGIALSAIHYKFNLDYWETKF